MTLDHLAAGLMISHYLAAIRPKQALRISSGWQVPPNLLTYATRLSAALIQEGSAADGGYERLYPINMKVRLYSPNDTSLLSERIHDG